MAVPNESPIVGNGAGYEDMRETNALIEYISRDIAVTIRRRLGEVD